MHISDGVLPAPLWIGGYAAAGLATGFALARFREDDVPGTAVMASLCFIVSSVFSIRLANSSVHLLLNGLLGVVLGWKAFPAILIVLGFQLLFLPGTHGGITTLGINTFNIALGAVAGRYAFLSCRRFPAAAGLAAGTAGVAMSGTLFFAALLSSGEALKKAAEAAFLLHIPVLAIEALVTAFAVAFLARVKPELLGRRPA